MNWILLTMNFLDWLVVQHSKNNKMMTKTLTNVEQSRRHLLNIAWLTNRGFYCKNLINFFVIFKTVTINIQIDNSSWIKIALLCLFNNFFVHLMITYQQGDYRLIKLLEEEKKMSTLRKMQQQIEIWQNYSSGCVNIIRKFKRH